MLQLLTFEFMPLLIIRRFMLTYSKKLSPFIPELQIINDNFGYQIRLGDDVIGGFRLPDEACGYIETIGGNGTSDHKKHCIIDPSLEFFAACYAQFLRFKLLNDPKYRQPQIIPVVFKLEYLDSSANRHVDYLPMNLTVRGGRYKPDGSDGISLIGLSEVTK